MAGWLKWAVAAGLSVAAAVGAQGQLSRVPPPEVDVNLLFVPPPGVTKAAATGYENLIADGLWLGLMQYYGDRMVQTDRRCVNLPAMFGLITELDPDFWFAYWLGAWAMADNDEENQAVALLRTGAAKHPDDPQYPFLEGYIHFLYRYDYEAAASAFERSASLPNAPRHAKALAARMYQHVGRDALALGVWQHLYDAAPDAATRRIAQRNLERVKAELAGKAPRIYYERAKRLRGDAFNKR